MPTRPATPPLLAADAPPPRSARRANVTTLTTAAPDAPPQGTLARELALLAASQWPELARALLVPAAAALQPTRSKPR